MKKLAFLGKGLAVAVLSTGALAGITTGVAHAMPREINCLGVHENASQSLYMAGEYYSVGDTAQGDWWWEAYEQGQRIYNRYCLS